jgi:hypothetical protein
MHDNPKETINDRVSKLPKWTQAYIQELEKQATEARDYAVAVALMMDGSIEIEPDVLPPEDYREIRNGWIASRQQIGNGKTRAVVEKACTSSVSHNVGNWVRTTTKGSISLFSSPVLALRSLLPEILKAYGDEMVATVKMIREYEQNGSPN